MIAKYSDGFSARRDSIKQTSVAAWLFILGCVILISCHEKSNGQDSAKADNKNTTPDSLYKPKVNIKVNRHYDDKGNVVGFDSTYTSFYSNVEGDTGRMDSLIKSFDLFFRRDHARDFHRSFNSLFFNDSLRYPDFFHDDFFMKRYELNDQFMRDMMRHMDSVKNGFYRDRHDLEGPQKNSSQSKAGTNTKKETLLNNY
jgi:hypothetical protein